MKSLIALTSTVSACVGHHTADAEVQVMIVDGRGTPCRCIVTDSVQFSFGLEQILKSLICLGLVFDCPFDLYFAY